MPLAVQAHCAGASHASPPSNHAHSSSEGSAGVWSGATKARRQTGDDNLRIPVYNCVGELDLQSLHSPRQSLPKTEMPSIAI